MAYGTAPASGWSMTSRRSGHLGAARCLCRGVHGRAYLRTGHRASSSLRRRGRTVTLGVNERLLNKAEREQLFGTDSCSQRTHNRIWHQATDAYDSSETNSTSIALLCFGVPVLAGAFALAMNEDKTPEPHPIPLAHAGGPAWWVDPSSNGDGTRTWMTGAEISWRRT